MSACGAGQTRGAVPRRAMPPRPPPDAHPLHHMAWDAVHYERTRPLFPIPNLGIDDVRRAWKEGAAANLKDAIAVFNPGGDGRPRAAPSRASHAREEEAGGGVPAGTKVSTLAVDECGCPQAQWNVKIGDDCPDGSGTISALYGPEYDESTNKCVYHYKCKSSDTRCECYTGVPLGEGGVEQGVLRETQERRHSCLERDRMDQPTAVDKRSDVHLRGRQNAVRVYVHVRQRQTCRRRRWSVECLYVRRLRRVQR